LRRAEYIFSVYLILLNHLSPGQSAWRSMLGQLIVVMMVCLVAAAVLYPHLITQKAILTAIHPPILWDVLLLAVFATIIANGLMVFYQPNVDPTRAAMIYLTEPIFAAAFAYLFIHETLTPKAMLGGGLILAANLLVELWEMRVKAKAAACGFEVENRLP
jgi:drug/metabolite transporter (DMT)-like permease